MQDDRQISDLLQGFPAPHKWKWITPFAVDCDLVIEDRRHRRWMKDHQETHPCREIMLCLSGEHLYGCRGKIWKIVPGTVMLIDRGDDHDAIYPPHQPPSRDVWLHLIHLHYLTANEIIVSGEPGRTTCGQRPLRISHIRSFSENLDLAWDRCRQNPRDRLQIAQLKAAITSLLLEAILHGAEIASTVERISQQAVVVEEIKKYIKNHLGDNLSVKALADIAGYDRAYFHRLFARFSGEPLHRYINRERLEAAKHLLKSGYKTSEIAENLGFASSSYFCRFFKRESQDTPTKWLERSTR